MSWAWAPSSGCANSAWPRAAAAGQRHAGGRGSKRHGVPISFSIDGCLAPRCAGRAGTKSPVTQSTAERARHGRQTIAARRYSGAARRWVRCKTHTVGACLLLPLQANLYALGAIALWASLASLGVSLTHIPPFLLTGITLIIGSVPAWPFVLRDPSQWRIPCCARWRWAFMAVCVPLSAVHRAAACATGGGQPRQLPVAPVHRGAGPGGVARRGAAGAACRGSPAGVWRRSVAIVGGRELSGTLAWGYSRSGGGVHLGHLFVDDQTRHGLPHHRDWLVRAGFRRLVAAVPCAAGAQRGAAGARLEPAGRAGPGPAGRAFLWDKASSWAMRGTSAS